MEERPKYKQAQLRWETWACATRITAITGEPRTQLYDRLMKQEEARLKALMERKSDGVHAS